MSGGTGSRHAACMECRQRKVRCDGGLPCCQNCLRRGSTCVFTPNSSQEKEKMLLMINELSDRLSHAEKSLATQHSRSRQTPLPPQDANLDSVIPETNVEFQDFWNLTHRGDNGSLNEINPPLFPEFHEFGTISDIHPAATSLIHPELESFSWPDAKTSQATIGVGMIHDIDAVEPELSSHTLHELYGSYFDQTDSSCYMLDQKRFLSKIDCLPLGPELLSLKYIVLAHGASSPSHCHLQNQFYDASRKFFEDAETGKAFVTIAALQACILLAMYELKQLLFSRAWGRVSRAMWMAQMFGLHRMDTQSASPRQQPSRFHLALTTDLHELEERRRTFWSAFNLSCFTSTSAGWNNYAQINHEEITTLLPAENATDSAILSFRPTLRNTLELSASRKLSNFEGLILTSALYSRCLKHADFAVRDNWVDYPGYDFWMHHYHISESVNQVTSTPYLDPALEMATMEPAILYMNLRIQAILICLHHAAVMRESKSNPTGSISSESETKCLKAAMKVTNMTRQIREQAEPSNSGLYILWSVYVAAQVYVRALHASSCGGGRPITPMYTPTTPSRSPKLYPNRWSSSTIPANGANMNISSFGGHSSGSSFSSISSNASTPSRFDLLENIDCLLGALFALKRFNPIAGIFEAQIYHELSGGKALTDDRPVGRVEFPLDGKYMTNEFFDNGVQDIWKLL